MAQRDKFDKLNHAAKLFLMSKVPQFDKLNHAAKLFLMSKVPLYLIFSWPESTNCIILAKHVKEWDAVLTWKNRVFT